MPARDGGLGNDDLTAGMAADGDGLALAGEYAGDFARLDDGEAQQALDGIVVVRFELDAQPGLADDHRIAGAQDGALDALIRAAEEGAVAAVLILGDVIAPVTADDEMAARYGLVVERHLAGGIASNGERRVAAECAPAAVVDVNDHHGAPAARSRARTADRGGRQGAAGAGSAARCAINRAAARRARTTVRRVAIAIRA